MKKYDNYKNSGVEWLGEIPEHWEVKKLKFIFNQNKGLTITKQNLIDEGVFCVNYGEIHSKFGFALDTSIHKLKCVNEEYLKTDPNSLLNTGDFIFADTSEDIEGSGNFTHLRSSDKTFAGYHTVIARPKVKITSLFFAFVFDSISFRNQIRKEVKGVKVFSITQSVLKETNIWIPTIQEQTAIANFLDDKTTKIDQAIAIKQQQIALLQERRKMLIHKAVTQGLNENVKLKDSGVEWIGEIPEHWELSPLRHIGKTQNGISKGGESFGTGYPFVSYGDVYKDIQLPETIYGLVESTNEDRIQYSVLEGDILFTRTSETVEEIGFSSTCLQTIENATFAGFLIRFRPQKNKLNKEFSKYYFSSSTHRAFFIKEMNLVIRASLSQDLLKRMPVLLPPISEQEEIGNYLNNSTTKIATAISLKEQEIEKLKEYKMSLIDGVVTGKVKVC
nr:restriction endonuclease subunit S [uncultured Flavobacterium sp.]